MGAPRRRKRRGTDCFLLNGLPDLPDRHNPGAEVLLTMRLGELLVSAGKITPAELDETLKGQAIFGGRFGTNLVEMGYLDEHDLAHFLSKKTGISHASPEQLMDVPPQVLRLIPEETARKHKVIPIAINNRKLTLAMVDPTDFATIDEISFATGYIVVPILAPELRMVSALEKHYKIKRELRYIRVEGGGRNRGRQSQAPAHPPQMAAVPNPPPRAAPVSTPPVRQATPAPPAQSNQTWLNADEAEILELPPLDEFECFGDQTEPSLLHPLAGSSLHREPEKDYTLVGALTGLAQAQDRHGVAELIVDHLAQQFNRVALFLLKGGKATGWVAQCGKKPAPGFDTLEISLAEPSVLRMVDESKNYYLGPMPITPCNGRLIEGLGGGAPANNLLIPLQMMGRVVAVLYVDGGSVSLDKRVPELQKLGNKAAMAFEILILKSKILMT